MTLAITPEYTNSDWPLGWWTSVTSHVHQPRISVNQISVNQYPSRTDPGRDRSGLVFEAEPELEADLEVLDLTVLDLATDLGHLEPIDVTQRLGSSVDAVADRLLH